MPPLIRLARTPLLVTVCVFLMSVSAREALGQGGRLRSPYPTRPREESPVPPPLPPPPASRADGDEESVALPHPAPVRPRPARLPIDDWFFWWQLNADRYEYVKWHMNHRSNSRPLFVTDADVDALRRRQRWHVRSVERFTLPTLLRIAHPGANEPEAVVVSSLLALGKLAQKAEHVDVLLAAAEADGVRPPAVREAAALALGLLRREQARASVEGMCRDRVRDLLFDCLEEEGAPQRLRVHAALALGLLGDQPSEGGAARRREDVARLLDLAGRNARSGDVGGSCLRALALQPPEAVTSSQRAALRRVVVDGQLGGERYDRFVRAAAAFALGRLGRIDDLPALERVLAARRVPNTVKRSSAAALGALASRSGSEARRRIEACLLLAVDEAKDRTVVQLSVLSLARVLVADLQDTKSLDLEEVHADEVLMTLAERGSYSVRGFALLALGHVAHVVLGDHERDEAVAWLTRAVDMLRSVAASACAVRTRAAAVTSLGMAGDDRSQDLLLTVLEDETLDPDLRAAAAGSLGMAQLYGKRCRDTLRRHLGPDQPFVLRRASLHGLALLGHPYVRPARDDGMRRVLVRLEAGDDAERRNVVRMLAYDGDRRALLPLTRILVDRDESPRLRALAAAALGCVGDEEWQASLDLLRHGMSFRSVGVLTWRVLDLY